MKKTLCKAIAVTLIFMMLSTIAIYTASADKNKDFIVSEIIGKWEASKSTEIRTAKEAGMSKLVLEYPDVVLGSWQGNIQLSLTGDHRDTLYGKYIVEIPELNFSIEYDKKVIPDIFIGIGGRKSNELTVKYNGKVLYSKNETAKWPFGTRLDTRIYYSIWRNNTDTLGILLQDYYGAILSNISIFWEGNITYAGYPLTLRIVVIKDSKKPAQLSSYLYYNDVVEDKVYRENLNIKTLDIGTSIMFYTSIGFLLIALIANVFSKRLKEGKREEIAEVKETPKKKRKKRRK